METTAVTQNRPLTYMELDFGMGRQTNRVRVTHRKEAMAWNNGVTLYVMGEDRRIITQYLFTDLTSESPQTTEFVIADAVPPMVSNKVRIIRFLRMTRTLGSDHISLHALEAYLGLQIGACLSTSMYVPSQRYFAPVGMVSHRDNGGTDWFNLNDGHIDTVCHTNIAPRAYMQLDFGEEGIKIDLVRVAFTNPIIPTRVNGTTLYVMDKVGKVVMQYTFEGMTTDSPVVLDFDMDNRIIH
jgi:hypothetical protein